MKDILNIFLNGSIQPRTINHVIMDQLRHKISLDYDLTGFQLCFGQASDFQEMVDLELIGYKGYLAWRLKDFQYDWDKNPHCVFFVLRRQGRLDGQRGPMVGLVHGRFKARGAHISHLIIHPDYQGQGHGKRLLGKWLEAVSAMSIPKVSLEVRESNHPAKMLYIQHGFKQVGTKYFYYGDNNENALEMECRL